MESIAHANPSPVLTLLRPPVTVEPRAGDTIGRTHGAVALAVYWCIDRHTGKDGACRLSLDAIAEALTLSVPTVRAAIDALTPDYLCVTRPPDNRRANAYRLTKAAARPAPAPTSAFDRFYTGYPKQKARGRALMEWQKIKPDTDLAERIITSVAEHVRYDETWTRDDGRYIPLPATFLSDRRWEDQFARAGLNGKPPENYGVEWKYSRHYGTEGAKQFHADIAAAKEEWERTHGRTERH